MDDPQWLSWVRQLQAIAQTGLTYAKDVYDIERYQALRRLAAEMAAAGAGLPDAARILDLFSRDKGYATPKVDVRAAVFQDERILLVKEHEDGLWTLPGGWADIGDSPSQAAVREVKEESGYDVRATKIAAVYDRNLHGHPPIPFHAYKLYFLCDLIGGEAKLSHETDAVEFFAENEIPPLSLTRVTPALIAHLFEHHRHPEWPTSFD
ncbi:NUDIX hydrolase [Paludibaculum fermentans]|uniref:NUDIX hydrolase n=1 Tax=Paludibaculum fermentans TaxID=1473598 RepID=UPI003EB7D2F1